MSIEFAKAYVEDAAVIARMRKTVWESTYRGIYPDDMIDRFDYAWHAEKDAMRIESPAYDVYLIKYAGSNAGYMILQRKGKLLLQSLYVLPEYQRCGIGRRTFEYLREYCVQNGYSQFTCHCQPQNINALKFYQKMGGVKVGEDIGNEESWQDSIILGFEII